MFTFTQSIHGVKNAAAHYQENVSQPFNSMRNASKSNLDDLIIFERGVNELIITDG